MKYLYSIFLINCLLISTVDARNCAQAVNNRHCSSSAGNSPQQSQISGGIATSGNKPDPSTTNNHLGTTTSAQPNVQVNPLVSHQVVGTAAVPKSPIMKAPPKPKSKATVSAPPLLPDKVPSATPKPPVMKAPPKPKSKASVSVPPLLPNKVPSATPTPQVMKAPPKPKSKTSVSVPPVQVYPNPSRIVTGQVAVPSPQPINVPPIQVYPGPSLIVTGYGAIPDPQPINVPPIQVYPDPSRIVTGYGVVPNPQPVNVPPQQVYLVSAPVIGHSKKQKNQPMNIPPKVKVVVQVPPNLQNSVVTPPLVSQPVVVPPVIITHVGKNKLHPDTLFRQKTLHNGLAFEKLKPGLHNMQVDVYHGKDASRMLYKDTHVMDKKGFHLTMLGTREAVFIDDLPAPATDVSADFIFYFDFASADIHQEEIKLFDQIIEARKKNKKRIIIMGETDDFGSFEFNKHLAISRSTKIVKALKERGIKDDEIELRIQVRCCRKEHPTKATLAESRNDRITWVHFE